MTCKISMFDALLPENAPFSLLFTDKWFVGLAPIKRYNFKGLFIITRKSSVPLETYILVILNEKTTLEPFEEYDLIDKNENLRQKNMFMQVKFQRAEVCTLTKICASCATKRNFELDKANKLTK